MFRNILLIHPPSREVYDRFERKAINRIPIGLAYIAAIAECKGLNVKVIDAEASELSLDEIASFIVDSQPDVVGVTCATPLYPCAVKILDIAKQISSKTITVLGGPHINALPKESLEGCKSADFVVYGEGDETFSELLEYLQGGIRYPDISGIGYRKGDVVRMQSPRAAIKNIDSIPFPARHKFPVERYHDPDRYNEPYTLLVTSRGCPYKCIFCGSPATWGRKVRFRSPENVLREIDEIVGRFNIRNITFSDDTFTLNKQNVLEISDGIVERGYGIKFLCSSRIDTIDAERLHALAKAGCTEITFGIESADEDILKTVCKDINIKNVKTIFRLVKEFGIRVHSSYIIGNPGDTHKTIEKTINFAVDSGTDAAQFSISTPYPGTPLWQMAFEQNKFQDKKLSEFKWYYSVAANLSNVSDKDLIDYQRRAYKLFEESKGTLL